tara:strand:- start:42 stop:290 length:249 start_codon:yes stop_codon:yes gene_type:complete
LVQVVAQVLEVLLVVLVAVGVRGQLQAPEQQGKDMRAVLEVVLEAHIMEVVVEGQVQSVGILEIILAELEGLVLQVRLLGLL